MLCGKRERRQIRRSRLSKSRAPLVWASKGLVYLGGIEPTKGGGLVGWSDGICRISTEELKTLSFASRNPVLSVSLMGFTSALQPRSWNFVQSLLSFWENETWEGPEFISVPESEIGLNDCETVKEQVLHYETLRVTMLKGDSLSENLLDVERCVRGNVKFHRLRVEYDSPAALKSSDFDRIVC